MPVCARRRRRGPPTTCKHRTIASSEPGSAPVRVLRTTPPGRRAARDAPRHPACSTPPSCGAHDPALHRTPLDVLLPLCEYRPVLPHAETPRPGPERHLARTKHVEDEGAAGDERVVNAPEKAPQPPVLVLRAEKVGENLADSRDCGARRDLDLEERPHS